MIGISPSEFWNSSPQEVYLALDGFPEFNGNKKEEPMDSTRLKEMMELNPD